MEPLNRGWDEVRTKGITKLENFLTRGDDINAACGQLVGQVKDRTRRQTRYLARVRASAG